MDCGEIKEYLYPFIDGELDSQNSLIVKEHLSICPVCNLEWGREKKIDSLIRQYILKEEAPFALKETIFNRIEGFKNVKVFPFVFHRLRPVLVTAWVALLAVVITFPTVLKKIRTFPVFSESISSHIEYLQGGLPVEIVSNNPQDVKNWFQGKVDFAIMVPDLSQKGVNLIGARLCHIREKKVAYLMYEKNGHNISLFIIDIKGINIPKANKINFGEKMVFINSEKGYQSLLCLKKGGQIGCIFVSDLPEDELIKIIT